MIKFEEVLMPDGRKAVEHMTELDCRVRFVLRGATYAENPQTGKPKEIGPSAILCDVVDRTTGETYAQGKGDDERTACISALMAARTAPKPLTAAQKADPNFTSILDRLKAAEARVAALEGKAPKVPDGNPPADPSGDSSNGAPALARQQKAAQTRAANKAAQEATAKTE